MHSSNVNVPEEAEPGTPGEVALLTGNYPSDWSSVKSRRALKRLHFAFSPRVRIENRPFSQQDDIAQDPWNNEEQVVHTDEDDIISIASTVLLTPNTSVEVQPATSTPTSTSSWLHTPHQLHRN